MLFETQNWADTSFSVLSNVSWDCMHSLTVVSWAHSSLMILNLFDEDPRDFLNLFDEDPRD